MANSSHSYFLGYILSTNTKDKIIKKFDNDLFKSIWSSIDVSGKLT